MTPHSIFEDPTHQPTESTYWTPSSTLESLLPHTLPAMENISQRFGALGIRKIAAIEALPLEILEKIFSYLPRHEGLAASRGSRNLRRYNEDFTWRSILVDIGNSSEFAGRTAQSSTCSKIRHSFTPLYNGTNT